MEYDYTNAEGLRKEPFVFLCAAGIFVCGERGEFVIGEFYGSIPEDRSDLFLFFNRRIEYEKDVAS